MKFPLSWISEFIDINLSPSEIAKLLTQAGLEVDSFYPLPLGFDKVVVGEVTKAERHPNAEKLTVATVYDGAEFYQVVCGAPNCREGMKTAFATVGATLAQEDGSAFKLKKTKLRGVESNGMLCSEKELGLGVNEEGIMEFSPHIPVGADLSKLYGDTIFEISLTPNLGHCSNMIGVARELAAATGKGIKHAVYDLKESAGFTLDSVSVQVMDKRKCPRYACRVIHHVKIAPSPEWMQKRLIACDLRPVNNVVDATNYVLMEMGHPLHAFDYDKIEGHALIVRSAKEGEEFLSLDNKTRKLCPEDLLIADKNKAVAIAGVMGGLNSEVTEGTVSILLESALFKGTSIRKTSKRLGLQSEASKRFERGCDPNNVLKALDRAAYLIQQIAGGEILAEPIDLKEGDFPRKEITCRLSRINDLLGTTLSLSEVESIFHRLEMFTTWDGKDCLLVRVPTYRTDIQVEVDLIEEAARIFGFDNIPKTPPKYTSSKLPHAPIYLFENEIRSRMIAEGLQEFLTCDLIGPTLLDIVKELVMPEEAVVKVMNPTSIEQSVLRTSLLPGLLQAAKKNFDHQCENVCSFEIGRIHFKSGDSYKERSALGIIMMGKRVPYHFESKCTEVDFYDIKGVIENLLDQLGVKGWSVKNNHLSVFHPGRQASLCVKELELGTMGEVHPAILRRLDVPRRIYFAEIDLHDLFQVRSHDTKVKEVPIYPSSDRDFTMTLKEEVPLREILDIIRSLNSRLLEEVSLKDVYRSEKIGTENKNVTLHFVYRDRKKTIAQEAVDAEHLRITSQIEPCLRR